MTPLLRVAKWWCKRRIQAARLELESARTVRRCAASYKESMLNTAQRLASVQGGRVLDLKDGAGPEREGVLRFLGLHGCEMRSACFDAKAGRWQQASLFEAGSQLLLKAGDPETQPRVPDLTRILGMLYRSR